MRELRAAARHQRFLHREGSVSELAEIREAIAALAGRIDRLEGLRRSLGAQPVVARVLEAAADVAGVAVVDILSQRREAAVVRVRFAALRVARRVTGYSLPRLGRAFGGRDHTTIMNALARGEAMAASDLGFELTCDAIEARFRQQQAERNGDA
jgi:chromosomal replication initiator protein